MKNGIVKRIVIAVLIVIAILVLLFVGREIAIRFFGLKTPSISKSTSVDAKKIDLNFDSNMSYTHTVNNKYAYFVATDRIYVVNNSGDTKAEIPVDVKNPIVKSSGSYVVVADLEGNSIYIIKGTDLKKNIIMTKKIKNVSVNSSGHCVVVTEGDMHKRDVTVYSEKGEELFVWNSGSMLVMDAVMAKNNKNVIISSLDTQSGTVKSIISFYNISKSEAVATETIDSELVPALTVYENYIYCVGESKTFIYNATGDKKGEISYEDKSLLSYEVNKNGIIMGFSESTMNEKRYSIGIYSDSGKKKSHYSHDYEAKYLDVSNNFIVVDRAGLVSVVDYNGSEQQLLDPGIDIEDLCFIGNTKKMVAITANGAYIISVK